MFTWLSSKLTGSFAVKTLPFSTVSGCIPGIGFFSTSASSLSQSAFKGLKKLYNLCPSIGLTGRGLTINGFPIIDLNCLNKLSQSLKFTTTMCLITAAQAAGITKPYQFMDPQRNTSYRLDLSLDSPIWGTVNPDDIANQLLNACNATNSTQPTPSSFSLIYEASKQLSGSGADRAGVAIIVEELLRATKDMPNKAIENCLKEIMGQQQEMDWTIGIAILAIVIPILIIGLGCIYKRSSCNNHQQRVQTDLRTEYGSLSARTGVQDFEVQQPQP